jgi:NADPH:quinone reductase-like Zn-dependent oxidoreductase
MRAARFHEYGGPEVLQVEEVDQPTPGPGQVQVEVHAGSINPWDAKLKQGVTGMPLQLPVTAGGDLEGTVTALGDGVTSLEVGDRVYGQAQVAAGNSGAFAEYAVTKADQVAPAPHNVDDVTAGALPLVAVSAWTALTEQLELKSGDRLLVLGGGGAIGSIAVQIAKHVGAYVAATASAADLDYVQGLGADEVFDYKTPGLEHKLHDFDALFDASGQPKYPSLDVLKRGGRASSMLAKADEATAKSLGVTASTMSTQVKRPALDAVRRLVEDGVVAIRIARTFPLDQISDAFAAFEKGARGKVVVVVKDKHEA